MLGALVRDQEESPLPQNDPAIRWERASAQDCSWERPAGVRVEGGLPTEDRQVLDVTSRCPLCGNPGFAAYRFGLLRCTECGLVVDRRVVDPDLDRQLNEDAFGEGYEPETSFWVRWFDSWKNRRYLGNLLRAGVQKGRLLEVGVGSGRFLSAARAAGFETEGCDLSESLARRVTEKTGIPVHCAELAALPARAFDVVCMHHVLEHVSDPVGLLRAGAERLRGGGVLHLAVPNGGAWEAHLPGWNCYAYYHLVYFDRATLGRACQAAGLAVQWMGSHASFSSWFLALARTAVGIRSMERPPAVRLRVGRGPNWGRLAEHPYRMAMVTAGVLTWPVRAVQSRRGRGDELIMIARATSSP